EIHQKIVLSGSKVSKGFSTKQLLENAEFTLYNHSRTALIGANGVGKTTLIKMIIEQDKHIQQAKNVQIGYFSQKLDGLDESQSILENVMKESIHEEDFVRMLLARLLFKGQDVYKKVAVISGGEKNKVSMAKLLVSSANVLIFDEPTNYLDLASIEAVESALKSYEGTILFVSHDSQFVENIATHYWQISDKKIKMWEPETLEVSPELVQDAGATLLTSEEKMLIENRLSALLGRISMPSKKDNVLELEKEYQELTQKLK
ncbi:MAG: ATP-binding cassette domain-containing protein, partial [Carnobacterium sp.]